jgi:iron-sulfur cluster repair protein YtfE (RIC family)
MPFLTRRAAAVLIAGAAVSPVSPAIAQPTFSDVINLLEEEHRAARGLVDEIVTSDNAGLRQRLFQRLSDALVIHNATEEAIVYPALYAQARRSGDAQKLYHQQDDAKILLWRMTDLPKNSPAFTSQMRQLQSALLAHIQQEEQVDFPAVRSALGPRMRELNEAARRLRAHWVQNPSGAGGVPGAT